MSAHPYRRGMPARRAAQHTDRRKSVSVRSNRTNRKESESMNSSRRIVGLLAGVAAMVGLSGLAVAGVSAATLPSGGASVSDHGVVNQTAPGTAGTYSGTV